jgi:hypothetical protein
MAPDFEIARDFIAGYLGSPDAVIRVVTMPEDAAYKGLAQEAELPIEALWPAVLQFQRKAKDCPSRWGIFYFINAAKPGISSGKKTKSNPAGATCDVDIKCVRALCIDDPKAGMPKDWHQPPDFIVTTSIRPNGSPKVQALWRVSDCHVSQYRDAQRRLVACYDSDSGVIDLRRVLRLPGTLHLKNPERPHLVSFERLYDGPVRCLAGLTEGLPPMPEKHRATQRATQRAKAVQTPPERVEAAQHPYNVHRARLAFERVVARYREQGGIPEGDRHRAMFDIAVQPFSFTTDVELVALWCRDDAFDLLHPGEQKTYEPADFDREVQNAYDKRAAEGTLANRATPLAWFRAAEVFGAAQETAA